MASESASWVTRRSGGPARSAPPIISPSATASARRQQRDDARGAAGDPEDVLRDGGGEHGRQDWLVVTVDGLLLLDEPEFELDVLPELLPEELESSSDDVV